MANDRSAWVERYRATARHWTAEARQQHEAMGFAGGWGMVAAHLAELAEQTAREK